MKLFLLMLLCVVIASAISAQGVTKNGASTNTSTTFVSRNSKIGSGLVLDRNGKVYVLASIFPKSSPPICFSASPAILTATGDGGTGSYTYQWYNSTSGIITGATSSTYSPANINVTSSNGYYCAITSGSYGTANTDITTVNVIALAKITALGGGSFNKNSNVTLTSSGTNIINQYWQGPNDFFSVAKDITLDMRSAIPGTYTVTGNSLSGNNLVTNGDFELGNIGFTSGYTLNNLSLVTEGTYAVVANPNSVHTGFVNCIDHSNPGTMQMVVNGALIADVNVWSETVDVVPGTDYQFTYWVQSVHDGNPSVLQLWVNGKSAGPKYTAIKATCNWIQFNYNWSSDANTTKAILSLTNQNIVQDGNDFALDDIVFKQVCNTTSSQVVTVYN